VSYFDQDLDRLTAEWIAAADAFLLGRRTLQYGPGLIDGFLAKTGPDPRDRVVIGNQTFSTAAQIHPRPLWRQDLAQLYALVS